MAPLSHRSFGSAWTRPPDRFLRSVVAVFLAMVITACGDDPSAERSLSEARPFVPPASLSESTAVWSAEPGRELTDMAVTLARGAAEADFIAQMYGAEHSYPGFERALTSPTSSRLGAKIAGNWLVGTFHWRLMSVSQDSESVRAQTCLQIRGAASRKGPGQYVTWPLGTIESSTIELSRVGAAARDSTTPSSATSSPTSSRSEVPHWEGPSTDVFDGWHVAVRPGSPADLEACQEWGYELFPLPPGTHDDGLTYTVTAAEPPPTLPAFPGWD